MTTLRNDLKVIKTQGNFDIIQLSEHDFVVRKRYKSLLGFGKVKTTFMVLDRNGVEFTFDSITTGVTVGGLERAEYVFNANVLKAGGV